MLKKHHVPRKKSFLRCCIILGNFGIDNPNKGQLPTMDSPKIILAPWREIAFFRHSMLHVIEFQEGRESQQRSNIDYGFPQQKMSGDGIPTEFEYELCVSPTILCILLALHHVLRQKKFDIACWSISGNRIPPEFEYRLWVLSRRRINFGKDNHNRIRI